MTRGFEIIWAGAIFSCVLSCAGKSEQASVSNDLAAACAAAAQIECTMAESCEAGYATVLYGSVSACLTRSTEAYQLRAASPGAVYGVAGLDTCTANQQAQTCDEWIGTLTPGCGFIGTKGMGEPCRDGDQCASGFCDDYLYYTKRDVCGVCEPPHVEGEPCSSACGGDGTIQCEHDATGMGHCVRLGSIGQTCSDLAPCATGLGCAVSSGSTAGQCQPATGNDGDACDPELGPLCDYRRRIFCNAQTHTCATAQLAAPGEACGTLGDGSVAECADAYCPVTVSSSTTGTCVAYIPDGAACTGGSGNVPCEPRALCAAGVCRIVGGEVCK
jgi:hypothetical protein